MKTLFALVALTAIAAPASAELLSCVNGACVSTSGTAYFQMGSTESDVTHYSGVDVDGNYTAATCDRYYNCTTY